MWENKRKAPPPPVRGKKRRRAREIGKNLLIVFLSLSAVYLLLRTQLYADFTGVRGDNLLGALLDMLDGGNGPSLSGPGGEEQGGEVHPLRVAVNLEGAGRYGVQYDQEETDRVFGAVFSLLGEALGTAGEPNAIRESEWRAALSDRVGVYFDFRGAVPLSVLHAWLERGGGNSALPEAGVRRLLLAEDGGGNTVLYYCNESDGMYYACGTEGGRAGQLRETLSAYSSNGAAFAYEKGEDYRRLDPYVLLGAEPPTAKVYRVSNPVSDEEMGPGRETLLTALDFHPQSSSSIRLESKLHIREGNDDELTIGDGGQVVYHGASASAPKYPVGALTPTGLVEATWRLCARTVGYAPWCGDARVYLRDVEETEPGVWQVDYGYSLNGADVRLGEEGYAARFTARDGRISDFTLYFRSYAATGEETGLLPEVLSAAAMEALGAGGAELELAYLDAGSGDTLWGEWIATEREEG